MPTGYILLVTAEGTSLTNKVVTQLEQQGHQVVVLVPHGIQSQNFDFKGVVLPSNTDEAIQSAIQNIETKYGKVGSFIHLSLIHI